MRGEEVDAGPRAPPTLVEEAGGAEQPGSQAREEARIAFPVAAQIVAVGAVPFRPAGREIADLEAFLAEIPRLRDQLHLRQDGVLPHRREEVGRRPEKPLLAGQRRREVEAEAVDVAFLHPVAQRIQHHLENARMLQVHRVAAAGGVEIEARIVGEHVVAGVVDAAEGEGRPQVVAFGGVIVDHVEQHLDARLVQAVHHLLELADVAARRHVALGRREEAERIVAPVVPELLLDKMTVVEEFVHGQQLDRRHAKPHQVLDDRRIGETGKGAALTRRHRRMARGHALDVGLVDDGVGPRRARARLAPPRERRAPSRRTLEHDALRHERRRIARVAGEVPMRGADLVAV